MQSKKDLYKVRLNHYKWLLSKGIKTTFDEVCTYKKPKVKAKEGSLDLSTMYKTNYPIPTSDRIPGACIKREVVKAQLPAGKTISIAYNKGNYQVVDVKDFTTMGRKI